MNPKYNIVVFETSSATFRDTENNTPMSTKNLYRTSRGNTRLTIALILFAIAIIGFVVMSADAQDIANPQRGVVNGSSYALSDIETINTTNGNLMLNIPLVSLPKGRGSVGGSISLSYSGKLWDTRVEELLDHSSQMTLQNVLYASYGGGWRYSVTNDYLLDVQNRYETFSPGACNTGQYAWSVRVVMWMPDGSQKQFAPTGRDDYYGDGYYDVSPDGVQRHPCPGSPTQWSTSGMVYYSMDGTYMKLVVDYVSSAGANGENNPWTMYMPDGSKITGGSGLATRTYDKNGNYVESLTDQLGRGLEIETISSTEDHVKMLGVAGEEIVWKVFWKTVEVDTDYETTGFDGGLGRGGTSEQPLSADHRVVDRIEYPEQLGDLEYSFHYNAEDSGTGLGQIDEITMPSGATVAYTYSGLLTPNTDRILKQAVASKTVTYLSEYDGSSSNVNETWTYSTSDTNSTITNPDGSYTTSYYGDTSYEHKMRGIVTKTVNSNGSRTDRIWTHQSPAVANNTIEINPFVDIEFQTIADSSGTPTMTKIVDKDYDLNGNVTLIKEYDWVAWSSVPKNGQGNPTGIPGGATLKRKTVNTYYNSVSGNSNFGYWDIDSLPARNVIESTEVQNGSSTPVARSEFFYDDEDDTANLTSTKVWDSFKGGSSQSYSNPLTGTNSITTSTVYNGYGMPTKMTDANNIDTVLTYGDVTCPGGTVTDLYPTLTEVAEGTPVERTSSAVYDCYTGLVTTATDEDNDVSVVTVYDDLGRPTIVKNAYGTLLESWVQTEYHDADRYVVTKADLEAKDDRKKVAIQHFDQLGRVRLSRTLENAATEDPADEQDGIKVQTRYATTYSSPNGYTYSLTSNPYRAATSSAASSEPTMGWTRSKAHHHGRHSEVETFSGATLPAPWGANSNSTGMVQTDIDANATTVTDQASKVRRSITNGLGQLIRVDEPTGAGLGTVGSPNQYTEYSYDTLGNLLQVDQGSQDRIFTYSSLSRLRSANNPESGTVTYAYDPNGNLTSKVDARSITTTYVYDEQNRVESRTYSGESGYTTPTVTYTYDNKDNAYGKLTKVSSSVSTTEYTAFDILGRVTSHKQTTDGNDYTTGYTYSLSGQLLEQTYPSGRVVKNTFDATDGSLSQVQSKRSSETYRNFANGFITNAAGAVTAMRLGNGKWENTVFNSRMQPTQIGLGNGVNSQDLLKLNYSYGTTDNNGNVQSQTITVPGVTLPFVQTYSYDSLNRLQQANEKPSGWTQMDCDNDPTMCWNQTFTFDRYGNRNFNEAETTTLPKNCGSSPSFTVCTADKKIVNPSVNTANNRLSTSDDYAFDSVGNTTGDAEGRTFVYDAENKQVSVSDTNGTIGTYSYDGDGRRIKKVVPGGETTIFIYDAGGKLIQEHSTIVQPVQDAKTVYTTNDHLGSPRINTDATGQVISRHDYHPFGEEIARTGYGSDTVRKQFTGYERDGETGLDFAQARYHNYSIGRFSSPDPLMASAARVDPQTFNRYSYVLNNPLRLIDPSGMAACDPATDPRCYKVNEVSNEGDEIKVESDKSSVAGCGGKTTGECSMYAPTPPSAGFVGPPPVVKPPLSPPVTAPAPDGSPGSIRPLLPMLGRAILTSVVAPAIVILALPGTANAPGPPPATRPTNPDDDERPRSITVYHYSTSPFSNFGNGLLPASSATDNGFWTSESASSALGIPEPSFVYPVTIDPRKTPMIDNGPVPPNRYGPGGGIDYYFPAGTPPGSVGPPRPVPRGRDLKPR